MPLPRCPNCNYELTGIGDEQSALCPECNIIVVLPETRRASRPSFFTLSLCAAVGLTPLVIVSNEILAGHPGVVVGAAWSAPMLATLAYTATSHLARSPRIAAAVVAAIVGSVLTAVAANVIAEIVLDLVR